MPQVNFDDALYTTYARGRQLDDDVMQEWMRLAASMVEPGNVEVIIDLGAGTGRFSTPLAATYRTRVVAVDPARLMLVQVDRSIERVVAAAERLPFASATADLVFASMVIHHFADLDVAAAEIARVLRPRGHVLVRTCFAETLDAPYHRFFPSVLDIERELLPTTTEAVQAFENAGLGLAGHERMRQRMDADWRSYAERSRQRAMSPLRVISDEEFASGMANLDAAALAEPEPVDVCETIDLVHFKQ
jgi:ubiquinone/menaquinone biosynthesis C-methylase UbiE